MNKLIAVCGMLGLASVGLGQLYDFTLNQSASSTTWSVSVSTPFVTTPTGTSFLIGNYDAATNPSGTRTIPGLAGGDTSVNSPIAITGGSLTANGSNGSTPAHPSGVFRLNVYADSLTCTIAGLDLDLISGQGSDIAVGVSNLIYQSFRERQPTCVLVGGIPLSLPLGNATTTRIAAQQIEASDTGTLVPAGGGSYTFSIPMEVLLSVDATFNGLPLPIEPQSTQITLTGTVTPSGDSASLSGNVNVADSQVQPGPIPTPGLAFDEPLCGGHLVLHLTLGGVTVIITTNSSVTATGTRICPPDFDGDGFLTGADFDLFVQAFEAGETSSDFDGNGFITGSDFDLFVQAYEAGC